MQFANILNQKSSRSYWHIYIFTVGSWCLTIDRSSITLWENEQWNLVIDYKCNLADPRLYTWSIRMSYACVFWFTILGSKVVGKGAWRYNVIDLCFRLVYQLSLVSSINIPRIWRTTKGALYKGRPAVLLHQAWWMSML